MFLPLDPMLLSDVAATKDRLAEKQNVEAAGHSNPKAIQATLACLQAIEMLEYFYVGKLFLVSN